MKHKTLAYGIAAVAGFIIGVLSTVVSAPAQTRFDRKVREDFFAGFAGNQAALERGMKVTGEALAANPKNAEAMVWHGAGLIFSSGQAFQSGDQARGMDLAQRGLGEMRTGADLEPDNVAVRIPRGAVLFAYSRFLPTPELARPQIVTAVGDFERTLELQKANFDQLGTHPRGELLFGLAEGYSRLGDQAKAQAYFERIERELPETVYAKRAAMWMETKTLPANQTGCVGCHVAK
jgi:hypothetical protein